MRQPLALAVPVVVLLFTPFLYVLNCFSHYRIVLMSYGSLDYRNGNLPASDYEGNMHTTPASRYYLLCASVLIPRTCEGINPAVRSPGGASVFLAAFNKGLYKIA
jgi:hypothetical protein